MMRVSLCMMALIAGVTLAKGGMKYNDKYAKPAKKVKFVYDDDDDDNTYSTKHYKDVYAGSKYDNEKQYNDYYGDMEAEKYAMEDKYAKAAKYYTSDDDDDDNSHHEYAHYGEEKYAEQAAAADADAKYTNQYYADMEEEAKDKQYDAWAKYQYSGSDDDSSSSDDDSHYKKYNKYNNGPKPAAAWEPKPWGKYEKNDHDEYSSTDFKVEVREKLPTHFGPHDKVECIAHLSSKHDMTYKSHATGKCAFAILPFRATIDNIPGDDAKPAIFYECSIKEEKLTSKPTRFEIIRGVPGNPLSKAEVEDETVDASGVGFKLLSEKYYEATAGSITANRFWMNYMLYNGAYINVKTENSVAQTANADDGEHVEGELRGQIFCQAHDETETSFSGYAFQKADDDDDDKYYGGKNEKYY